MSKHAEVEQEHRREAKRFCDAVDFLEEDELAQFLADHDAEVERKTLERCCKNCASGMSARMRAELVVEYARELLKKAIPSHHNNSDEGDKDA